MAPTAVQYTPAYLPSSPSGTFDFLFTAGKVFPGREILREIGPVIDFIDVWVEVLLFSECGDPSHGFTSPRNTLYGLVVDHR